MLVDIADMQEDNLNLAVGSTVQLQLNSPEASQRYMVRVVGYLPRVALVVTTPTVNGNVQLVREGQTYKVRMLRGDSVMGFNAKVLVSAIKPFPHLHLEYPKDFEQIVVRNAARVSVSVPCMVRNTNQPDSAEHFHKASIIDLSESGAKIASPIPLGDAGEMLQINFRLSVLDQTEDLSLVGDIKNNMEKLEEDEQGKRLVHMNGVQFRAVNRFQQVLLHAWVMGRVASGGNALGK